MYYQLKTRFLGAIVLATLLIMSGCGSDGTDGTDGADSVLNTDEVQALIDQLELDLDVDSLVDELTTEAKLDSVRPEACVLCHDDSGSLAKSGAEHQAEYEEFYQDQVIRIVNLAYLNNGTQDIVTFDMFKKDEFGIYQPFDCRLATSNPEPDLSDALSINWVKYDSSERSFSDGATSGFWRSIKGDLSYDGSGGCTSTKDESTLENLDALDGHVVVYGRDETLAADPAKHISSPKFPFAAMLKTGTTGTTYESYANASGCENCHTRPFLKHTYVYGEVSDNELLDAVDPLSDPGNDGNDFYVCKTCHLDGRNGGHQDWQILADNPERHAEIAAAAAAC